MVKCGFHTQIQSWNILAQVHRVKVRIGNLRFQSLANLLTNQEHVFGGRGGRRISLGEGVQGKRAYAGT